MVKAEAMVDPAPSGSITAVAPAASREKREQQPKESKERSPRRPRSHHEINDVAFVMGIPARDLTPRVQEALTIIMHEFDRVRDELEQTRERATHLAELADRHPILPLMNRRALLRELSHLLERAVRTATNSSFLYLEIANLGDIKRVHGRAAADAAMILAAEILGKEVRASDVVGSLGGSDLGVILTLTQGRAALDKARELVASLQAKSVAWRGGSLRLDLAWGLHVFAPGDTVDTVLDAAERTMRAQPQAPDPEAATPPTNR